MNQVYICDYIRTPIGRFGGALSTVRADDLGAVPLRALMARNPGVDWQAVDDVVYGCANQAGEDNRNVARMSALLAGLPLDVTGTTINRLCGSGMDAVLVAARQIGAGEADLMIAGGVESMSRAPFVMPKAETAFSRAAEIHDTTIGWRFVNPAMKRQYGVDSMPQTGQNVAENFAVSRADQVAMALASQAKAAAAQANGRLAREIAPVSVPQRKGDALVVDRDEHPRATTPESLAKLKPLFDGGSVTAGNASGVNDGAAALILASEAGVRRAGSGHAARPGHRRRRSAREPEWRRHRAGISPGHVRRPHHRHRRAATGADRRQTRPVHHVHRRRTGHRHRDGRGLRPGCPIPATGAGHPRDRFPGGL